MNTDLGTHQAFIGQSSNPTPFGQFNNIIQHPNNNLQTLFEFPNSEQQQQPQPQQHCSLNSSFISELSSLSETSEFFKRTCGFQHFKDWNICPTSLSPEMSQMHHNN